MVKITTEKQFLRRVKQLVNISKHSLNCYVLSHHKNTFHSQQEQCKQLNYILKDIDLIDEYIDNKLSTGSR